MRYVSRNHVNCCTTTATSCTSNPQQINKLEHRRFLLTTQSTCRCDVPNGSCTFIFWIYPHFLIMQCRKEAPVSKTLQLDSSNHLHTIIIIILIIKHIYIAQVRKGHKCAMSAEMAVWLRNCLCLYHHHQFHVADEGRRVVAPPCPRSTARLQRSPIGRVSIAIYITNCQES